jgi:hypothetical protein
MANYDASTPFAICSPSRYIRGGRSRMRDRRLSLYDKQHKRSTSLAALNALYVPPVYHNTDTVPRQSHYLACHSPSSLANLSKEPIILHSTTDNGWVLRAFKHLLGPRACMRQKSVFADTIAIFSLTGVKLCEEGLASRRRSLSYEPTGVSSSQECNERAPLAQGDKLGRNGGPYPLNLCLGLRAQITGQQNRNTLSGSDQTQRAQKRRKPLRPINRIGKPKRSWLCIKSRYRHPPSVISCLLYQSSAAKKCSG